MPDLPLRIASTLNRTLLGAGAAAAGEAMVADLAEKHADELESRVAQLRELVTRLRADRR